MAGVARGSGRPGRSSPSLAAGQGAAGCRGRPSEAVDPGDEGWIDRK